MELEAREVEAALLKKGFELREGDHHRYSYPGSLATTMVSHGCRTINDHLIKKMAEQVFLTRQEFLELVACPLDEVAYRKILEEKKKLNPEPEARPSSQVGLKPSERPKNAKNSRRRGK